MIRAYYKDNSQRYKDFEDFLFLFPEKHRIEFDFTSDTIWIDGTAFQLSKIEFISDNTEELDSRYERIENKNKPNGYAGLDENAKIPSELLPSLRVVDVHVVNNSRDLATLQDIDEGDLAIVVNENKTFVWSGSQWIEILFQDKVISVDGRTGAVVLSDLYAAKDHEHRRLVGDNVSQTTLKIDYVSIWGVTTTWFKSVFTLQQDVQFNQFVIRYPQTVNDFDIKITLAGQTVFQGKPVSIEKITAWDDKLITIDQTITIKAGQEVNFELTFPSAVALNMPKPNGSGYLTYHNYPNYTNPLPDVILFSELRLEKKELAELKNGSFVITTNAGELDVPQAIAQIFQRLTSLYVESDTEPQNPFAGQLWYNPTAQELKIYTSAGWALIPLLTNAQISQRAIRI